MKTLKKLIGILTLFGLIAGAFPAVVVADDVSPESIPAIQNLNFTIESNDLTNPVSVNPNGSYQIEISGENSDEYTVDVDDVNTTLVNSAGLQIGTYEVILDSSNVPSDLFVEYYSTKPTEPNFRGYLNDAAKGLKPFAFFEVKFAENGIDKELDLLDGALFELLGKKEPMMIPGDYLEGIFNLSSTVFCEGASPAIDLEFTLVISNGLTVKVDETLNNYEPSTEAQLIGDSLVIEDPSGNVEITSEWNIVSTRPSALTSYNVTVEVSDRAGNMVENTLAYDLKIYNPEPVDVYVEDIIVCPSVKLKEPLTAPTTQRFESFSDIGGSLEFSETANVWFGGDMNLAKVNNGYSLSYETECLCTTAAFSEGLSASSMENVRTVNVVDTKGPGALKNYVATGYDGYVQLKWENPTNLDFNGINIYRSTEKVFDWKTATPYAQVDKAMTSYEDKNVTNTTTYYYVLVPRDDMSPANYGVATEVLSATPNVVLVAAATSNGENASYVVEDTNEPEAVKSDVTEENKDEIKEDTSDKELPAFGIFVLSLLVIIGLYLLYLQKPEWFAWLMFWKK